MKSVLYGVQRREYKSSKLSLDRVARLEQLGFVWDPLAAAWEEMFAALCAYKLTHGDGNVPKRGKDNPQLGVWCGVQRRAYKTNKLSPDRVKRLEELGFVWDQLAVAWEEMFAALRAYAETHGDCNVPQNCKGNVKLGAWCSTQRMQYKKDRLSRDRVQRLEQLGFRWTLVGKR